MRLAVTQPYFFPYYGIYSLAHSADKFVLFDIVQYRRRSWMSRNRIFSKEKGCTYINAGVEDAGFKCLISEVTVLKNDEWKQQIMNKLKVYHKLENYTVVSGIVRDVIYSECRTLTELDMLSMTAVMEYLGLDFQCEIMSDMDIVLPTVNSPGDWSVVISEALGADEYINTPAGRDIFDEEMFNNKGIKLQFIDPYRGEYPQGNDCFVPYLSIIDMLMWNNRERCAEMVAEGYRILDKKSITEAWAS